VRQYSIFFRTTTSPLLNIHYCSDVLTHKEGANTPIQGISNINSFDQILTEAKLFKQASSIRVQPLHDFLYIMHGR
jgi:hypothetical protein